MTLQIIQKGELLLRLSWIIERLRGAPAHSPELVRDMLAIEEALIPLEAELAAAIDLFQARKYERHNRPSGQATDVGGLGGRWAQDRDYTTRRKGSE
jgi:hypothetical protein